MIPDALLLAVALLALLRGPRPVAVALVTLAAGAWTRRWLAPHPEAWARRLDVAIAAAWPVVGVALLTWGGPWRGAAEADSRADPARKRGDSELLGGAASKPDTKYSKSIPEPLAALALRWIRFTLPLLAFVSYASLLAGYGSRLAAWWPWPVYAPRVAALLALRRPVDASQWCGALLVAGSALGAPAWQGEPAYPWWSVVQGAGSCTVWLACGVICWRAKKST